MAVSPQTVEQCARSVDDFGVDFPLLSDEGNRVARRYGLVYRVPDDLKEIYVDVFGIDLAEYNGDDPWTLPMPARYLLDGDGDVRWSSVSPDHTDRPDPADTVEALEAMLS